MGKGRGILLNVKTGDLAIDIRRDAIGQITGGLQTGGIIEQNQAMLLLLHPGELKADPLIGVGISDMTLDESDMLGWRTRVRQSFEADGMKIKTLRFDNPNELEVDAQYGS